MDTSDRLIEDSDHSDNSNMFSHIVDIARAAFPYLDSDTQQSIDLIIKADDLLHSFHETKNKPSVTAFSIRKQSIDFEALLRGIREICYPRERQLIDMILNFFQAKKFYDTYSMMTQLMASQPDMADSMKENLGGMFGMDTNSNSDMSEMLGSLLTPEQKSTFDNLSMMLNMMQQN